MRFTLTLGALAVAVLCVPSAETPVAAQQSATFKSNVNMLAVDVLVVDKTGQPILGLQPEDFEVKINNHQRRVTTADLVQYSTNPTTVGASDLPAPRNPIRTPGRIPTDSRTFILAVDDASFSTGGLRPALQAAQRFVDNLRPNDMVGLYVYPFEQPKVDLMHDHAAVRNALGRMIGRRNPMSGEFDIGPNEMIELTARDSEMLRRVASRECPRDYVNSDPTCPDRISIEASAKASHYEGDAAQRIFGLGMLMQDLQFVPGRKTVVVISAGLLTTSRIGGRPEVRNFMRHLGAQAARSNVTTYVLHMDDSFSDAFSVVSRPSFRPSDRSRQAMSDAWAFSDGLDQLASEAGGVFLSSRGATGDLQFGRILRETMAYYLLGVEPTQADWDGKKLMVKVKTSARDATVRALKEVIAR
jgi:VWFA-related protein